MIEFEQIGTIHSPYNDLEGMPIQPAGAVGVRGRVEVLPDYVDGLQDLDGFSHIILLYKFHRGSGFDLKVVPFLDSSPRGVFATRAPRRPNPIGMSVVRLERIDGAVIDVLDIDVLNGTPLMDIKPYVPHFNSQGEVRTGWLGEKDSNVADHRSDSRFR